MKWKTKVEQILSNNAGKTVEIKLLSLVGGGSINEAYRLKTNAGNYFIKVNSAKRFPQLFEKEARGLEVLFNTNSISVPKVVDFGEVDDVAFLLLPFIESRNQNANFWFQFGEQLANLHRNSNERFGFDHNNYIGSLEQINDYHPTWADFFREERLERQLKFARDHGRVDLEISHAFHRFYLQLDQLFPPEPPALLHGDLWSGNLITGNQGEPVVIDPAVYYGNREMDLAMSQLFGGFDHRFYEAYHNTYPLENGWKKRVDYCNLYPLMVHVNLFGGAYLGLVKSILKSF